MYNSFYYFKHSGITHRFYSFYCLVSDLQLEISTSVDSLLDVCLDVYLTFACLYYDVVLSSFICTLGYTKTSSENCNAVLNAVPVTISIVYLHELTSLLPHIHMGRYIATMIARFLTILDFFNGLVTSISLYLVYDHGKNMIFVKPRMHMGHHRCCMLLACTLVVSISLHKVFSIHEMSFWLPYIHMGRYIAPMLARLLATLGFLTRLVTSISLYLAYVHGSKTIFVKPRMHMGHHRCCMLLACSLVVSISLHYMTLQRFSNI